MVLSTITFFDIAKDSLWKINNYTPTLDNEVFEQDVEYRMLTTGEEQKIRGGFRYRATVRFPLLDKNNAEKVKGIINHCARAGYYLARFYPHSDNDNESYLADVTGEVTDLMAFGEPKATGHEGVLYVRGVEPFEEIPGSAPSMIQVIQDGVSYPTDELYHTQVAADGVSYSQAELENHIGQLLTRGSVVVD